MRLLIGTSVGAFIMSLAAKLAADAWLHERVAIAGSFVGLQPSQNPGIAFGLRLPPVFQELLILVALAFVIVLARRSTETRLSRIGYGLIIGGALGNIADRTLDGLVTDFFQIGTFPVFNVSDSCITVGVLFLLADAWILSRSNTH